MAAKERKGSRPGEVQQDAERPGREVGSAVTVAINRGFVIGREVLVGNVPGIVVGYNIAGTGHFLGNAYPLVVRTALGVTKCAPDELSLA
ncbi:MAG: hypothetical protein Q8M11_02855 [Sulfuritalea sp.]|jgi:hypothetical protein|nr:hypothetical protein [Sulfuritalea sp.]MDP1981429.1 hypothetical protein [Sulfuritalea sp.]